MEKQLSPRLSALLILDGLEKKVNAFKIAYGDFPKKIKDLVEKGFIEIIPKPPYGEESFMLENGRVFTTSKLIFNANN